MTDRDRMLGDERYANPIEPDVLMPSQFVDRVSCRLQSGELRLMAAVLEDAIGFYCRNTGYGRGVRALREAEEWIQSTDRSWVFSFERICEALSLDADYIRRGLRAWRRRRTSPMIILPIAQEPALAQQASAAY